MTRIKFSDRKKAWNKKAQKSKRPLEALRKRKRYLIVCEGEKTEPYYFRGLEKARLPENVVIVAHGFGKSTLSLVKHAIDLHHKLEKIGEGADEVWLVFDKDDFKDDAFDNAITKCEAQKFKTQDNIEKSFQCAWSNESFELWYLLHFKDVTAWTSRKALNADLSKQLGYKYSKADEKFYSTLQEKGNEAAAIDRAEKLLQQAVPPWHNANPATKVHELVQVLLTHEIL